VAGQTCWEPFHACLESFPRLLLFTGKGGVGKTTCSAAAGVALAARGAPTLLFSTDPAHSLSDSLEQPVGPGIRPVAGCPNLWALELDARSALAGFKQQFGEELYDLVMSATYLGEEDARDLLDLELPGLDELMGLHQIFSLLSETPPRFQHMVWDSAPTGHTLRLLDLPTLIDQWVRAVAKITWRYRDLIFPTLSATETTSDEGDLLLALKRTIRLFQKSVRDPTFTRMIPVLTLEPMVGAETVRLVQRLRELRMPLEFGVVNAIQPDNPTCAFCHRRYELQQSYLDQLQPSLSSLRLVGISAQPRPIRGMDMLRVLGIGGLSPE
jgi:arsenite-transporting ATPase